MFEEDKYTHTQIAKMIWYFAETLCDSVEDVKIDEEIKSEEEIVFHLSVPEEERGRVIGKGGRIIESFRTILRIAGAREGLKYYLQV